MKIRTKLGILAILPLIAAALAIGTFISIHSTNHLMVLALCLIPALALTAFCLIASHGVSKSIADLHESMRTASSENRDTGATIHGVDELGELAGDFKTMRKQLEASRDELAHECEEHKKTAASLRETNRHLSDVLIKLKRAQQQSIEQERMLALKQIANGIVHDFNSSLTPILGTTEYLISTPEALGSREDILDSLRLIDEAAKAARNLVRDLSEFFRPTTTEMNDLISVNDIVQNAISLTKPKWKEQSEVDGATITVVTDLRKNAPTIHGNRVELEEALTSLILNALDAMPTGGTLTLKTRIEGDISLIEISDSGEGMTPEIQDRCFEPFFSTKGPGASGMGLAIAKGIIARHKGTLALNSEPTNGTTVSIKLPTQTIPPPRKTKGIDAAEAIVGLHVLVVDDESWSRRIMEKYLSADRCTVETAVDGHDALVKLGAGKFDLVILDRAMPAMSGDQLAIQIRKSAPKLPIVMMTGFGDIMEERGEHPKDVDIVVGKPFTRIQLRSAIKAAIEIHGKV